MTTYHPDATGECTHCDEPIDGHVCPTHDSPCAIEGACMFTALEKDRSAAVVALETAQARVQELEQDQRMLATVIRNTVLAIGDVGDDWEGSVAEGVDLINANVEKVNRHVAELERDAERERVARRIVDEALRQMIQQSEDNFNGWAQEKARSMELEREVARLQQRIALGPHR